MAPAGPVDVAAVVPDDSKEEIGAAPEGADAAELLFNIEENILLAGAA